MTFGLPPGFQEQRIIHETTARSVERHHAVRRGITETTETLASTDPTARHAWSGWIPAARRALQGALARIGAPRTGQHGGTATSATFAWDDAHRLTDISCLLPDGASGVVALVTEDGNQWTAVCVRSPWTPA